MALARLRASLGPESTPTFTGTILPGLTASRLVQTDGSKALSSVANLASWVAGTANEIDITDDGDGTITVGLVNPLIVSKGGTGAATLTTAYGLLAAGTTATGAVQTLAAGLTTQILVGGGASALPVWGTDIPTAITIGTKYIYRADGTDVPVADGGTGASTLTDHGLLLGSGTDPVTPLGAAINGQIPIGSTGADPVLATITGTANQITVTNGAGSITLSAPQDIHTGASPTFAGLTVDTDTLYVDSVNHRVGVGTTTPAYVLQVVETLADTSAIQLKNLSSDTAAHAMVSLHVKDGGGDPAIGFGIDDADGVSIGHSFHLGIDNSDEDKLKLAQGSIGAGDVLTVTQDGKVGIGTTAPSRTLHVAGNSTAGIIASERNSSDTYPPGIYCYKARGTMASRSAVQSGDQTGGLSAYGWDGDEWVISAYIGGIVDGAVSDGVCPGAIQFMTGSTSGTLREAARLTTGLRMGIRITAPAAVLDIDQTSTSGAIPVLKLDQGDVSEEFVRFVGTSANGILTQSIVEAADVATATIAGYVKVYVQDDGNQLADQAYYMPLYTLA